VKQMATARDQPGHLVGMMKKWVALGLVALTMVGTVACTVAADEAGTARSEKQRVTAPDVSASDQAGLVQGNSAFAFDLYAALRERDGNLFYSPHSISIALAMVYAGARGETQRQMADTLHFLPQDRVHPAFNALDLKLAGRGPWAGSKYKDRLQRHIINPAWWLAGGGPPAWSKDKNRFQSNIVNAVWGQKDYVFLDDFLDVLGENYGAGIRTLDFKGSPGASRNTVNDWVSDQTKGKINDLVPGSSINQSTRLILTNAIYFNAAWLHRFNKSKTKDGTFYLTNGQEVEVPMMTQKETFFGYFWGDGYQAVELPYTGGELSMIILLPDAGRFKEYEAVLDAETVRTVSNGLRSTEFILTMPKFEFESDFSLIDVLSEMGMPDAFFDTADFSGMTGNRDLRIEAVLHKAYVAVDEDGTEAAAATIALMQFVSAPMRVIVDRPFVFLIRDIETGAILFLGRVVDPRS